MVALRDRTPDITFALLVLAAAGILLAFGSGLTFFLDEWLLLLSPEPLAPGTVLDAHNGQLFVVPSLVYGVMLHLFGMTSQLPFRVVNVAAASICAGLLFLLIRRWTSPWLALVMVLPALVLGVAWEALLLPLSMSFLIGLACGLGMLLALGSDHAKRDPAACLLLLTSLACGGIGLAFTAGATADLVLRREPRRWWVAGLPLICFGSWYLTTGPESGPRYLENLITLPAYLEDAGVAAVRAVTGFTTELSPGPFLSLLPHVLLGALLIAILVRSRIASEPVPREAAVIGVTLLAFLVMGGLAANEDRGAVASRYQYPAAVLLLALAGALLSGLKLPRWLPLALLPLALFSVASNLRELEKGREFLNQQTEITRSATAGLEAFALGLEDLTLTPEVTGSEYQRLIVSGPYFRAIDRFGSPAYDAREMEAVDLPAARAADGVEMAAALRRAVD